MTEVVQIVCPHCRNALRIPAEWVEQPMRCKFCRQVFQAHRKGLGGDLPTTPWDAKTIAMRSASHRGLRFPFKSGFIAGLVISTVALAALVVGIILGPALQKMAPSETPPEENKPAEQKSMPAAVVDTGKTPSGEAAKDIPVVEPKPKPPEKNLPTPEPDKKPPEKDKKPLEVAKVQPDKDKERVVSPELKFILNEMALFPPATGGKAALIDGALLPEFSPEILAAYEADYKSILDFKDKDKEFPIKAAIAKTIVALRENVNSSKMRATIPGHLADKQLFAFKNQVKAEQDIVAQKALVLKDLLKELVETGDKHRSGAIKRCQVLFDYALLRLKARVVYVVEYNFNLAQIRTDSLAKLEPDDKVYRLTPQDKVTANEAYIKQYVKDLKKGWTELAKNHPETPWAVLASQEQAVQLGMVWQPAKQ